MKTNLINVNYEFFVEKLIKSKLEEINEFEQEITKNKEIIKNSEDDWILFFNNERNEILTRVIKITKQEVKSLKKQLNK